MRDLTANATVTVARGSTSVTLEVAAILAEGLSGLGLRAQLGEIDATGTSTPIIVLGQGATVAPPMSPDHARRAIVVLLAGPGTQAFKVAAGLAEVATGCLAVSPRTVTLLRDQGIRTDRLFLGHAGRWDTGGAANGSRPIDILHIGELDGPGRRVLARLAPELAGMHSHIDLTPTRFSGSEAPPTFGPSQLLADATLTLSLNRWGNTTLDWPTVVRAMCNGSVVIAERTTGYGELVPGEHFLMTRAENIEPVIRASHAAPEMVAEMAARAYKLCRTELSMTGSIERLATLAARPRAQHRMARRVAQQVTNQHSSDNGAQRLRFEKFSPHDAAPAAPAEIDVICVQHPGAGPISLTRDSLAGQPVNANLHVGTIRYRHPHRESSEHQSSEAVGKSIAAARNELVSRSSAPFLMFIDPGDEVFNDVLGRLILALRSSSEPDISVSLAAIGSDDVTYPTIGTSAQGAAEPEAPQRGYIVRRSYLNRVGPFETSENGADGVDRAFWRLAKTVGGRVALLPQVGLRLWRPM